jgi:hypothetical protein
MKKKLPLLFSASLLCCLGAKAQTNLIPNGDFSAKDPLQGWRISFPYEEWYKKNENYVKATSEHARPGRRCVVIELPPGVAGNEGGKIESAFVKAEPGATYRVMVDCMTWNFSAKVHAEAYVPDPRPNPKPSKFVVPALNGMPALVMCYRAQLPDPPGGSKKWDTVQREFTLPKKVNVAGKELEPQYLSLKAYVYAGTQNGGKSFFDNFRLYKIK